ncbi:MAG: DUF402 domain-containing protein [Nitrososphaerota archaeon]
MDIELRFSIRGIYSTALTKHLLDHGHELVNPTKSQAERFGACTSSVAPDVIINDTGDKEGVVIQGGPESVMEFVQDIREISWQVVVTPIRIHGGVASARIYFPAEAKTSLDIIRAKITYTLPYHHFCRAGGETLSNIVSMLEELVDIGALNREIAEQKITGLINRLAPRKGSSGMIHHLKPLSGKILLGPFRFYRSGEVLIGRRIIKGFGKYNGLGVDKTPGDVSISRIKRFSWRMETRYYGLGNAEKGRYINISTPIHLYESHAWYIDLGIDVVEKPNGERMIIDAEELEQLLEKSCISRELYEKAMSEAKSILDSS